MRLTRRAEAIRFRPPRPRVAVGDFSSHNTLERRAMGKKNLPANAALETSEMLSLGKLWPVWGVLVACVCMAFSPVLSNGFVDWDDHLCVLENHSF